MPVTLQMITLVTVAHIGTMFMVVEGNNDLTIYQEIKYYFSLFVITYSTEVFSVFWNGIQYNARWLHIMNYILMPLLVIPVIGMMLYIVGFSLANMLNRSRVIICVLLSIISYRHNRNYSFIIPMMITYLPLFTICKHICVVFASVVFAKLSRNETHSR